MNPKLLENLQSYNADQLAGIRMGLALADGIACRADLRGDNELVGDILKDIQALQDKVAEIVQSKAVNA